jgi:glucose uptake protein GlcU
LISGIVSILTGWANARFGLAGTKPEQPKDVLMNYFGVVFCAISVVFFVFVKNESMTDQAGSSETEPLISSSNQPGEQFFNDTNPTARQFIGIVITVISGFLFAISYIPYLYVIDNYENASDNGLDYVFSMYSGIFIASMMFFTIYSIIKKNKPFVNAQAILPGFASGFLWGTANCCFLFANSVLSQTVTFPIAGSIPPIVASFYGIFLFKEIKGTKNFLILSFGFLFTLIGSILCGLSK